jgi:hypothetical protein
MLIQLGQHQVVRSLWQRHGKGTAAWWRQMIDQAAGRRAASQSAVAASSGIGAQGNRGSGQAPTDSYPMCEASLWIWSVQIHPFLLRTQLTPEGRTQRVGDIRGR